MQRRLNAVKIAGRLPRDGTTREDCHSYYAKNILVICLSAHSWSSGRIGPCHGPDPGSIPGECTHSFCQSGLLKRCPYSEFRSVLLLPSPSRHSTSKFLTAVRLKCAHEITGHAYVQPHERELLSNKKCIHTFVNVTMVAEFSVVHDHLQGPASQQSGQDDRVIVILSLLTKSLHASTDIASLSSRQGLRTTGVLKCCSAAASKA